MSGKLSLNRTGSDHKAKVISKESGSYEKRRDTKIRRIGQLKNRRSPGPIHIVRSSRCHGDIAGCCGFSRIDEKVSRDDDQSEIVLSMNFFSVDLAVAH